MNKLNMNIEEIRNQISLTTDLWKNEKGTNCYAFALGLDIPEDKISKDAYQIGVLGYNLIGYDYRDIVFFSYEERLKLDLMALRIKLKETVPDFDPIIKYYNEKGESFTEYSWPIALFESSEDAHFLRKSNDGLWYHKYGYESEIINRDINDKIITNPKECDLGKYKYKKTYKLTLKNLQ